MKLNKEQKIFFLSAFKYTFKSVLHKNVFISFCQALQYIID